MNMTENIQHMLKYSHDTREFAMHLDNNGINIIHWWVDTSYGVQNNLKVPTGTTMPIEKGCLTSM